MTGSIGESCHQKCETTREISMVEARGIPAGRPGLILAGIFLTALLCLFFVYHTFPQLDPSEKSDLNLPKSVEEAKRLGLILSRYSDKYYITVFCGILLTYVFLQAFAIPGSIFLTVLSGYLFPFPVALFIACFCSAVGASLCYILACLLGRPFLMRIFPERVTEWSSQVNQHRENLLFYIIFLRITPILPNWFINITSPVVNIPFVPFFFGTLLGVGPPSCVAISAGKTLNRLTSAQEVLFSPHSIAVIMISAFISVIPVIFREKIQQWFRIIN